MRTIERAVFPFSELSDAAKERVVQCYAENFEPDQLEMVVDDFVEVAALLGFTVSQRQWTNAFGYQGSSPEVYWRGFYTQGSCAYFFGDYEYRKGAVAAVKGYAPQDAELRRIAERLREIQRPRFYRLKARVKSDRHGDGMAVDAWVVDRDGNHNDLGVEGEREVSVALKDLAHWLWKRLRDEYEYQTSEEAVVEMCADNEREFYEDGSPV